MKKYLVRVYYKERGENEDLVAVIKTKDIEKYMNDFVKDVVDLISGYEYQELRHLRRNSMVLLCGSYIGASFIKVVLKKAQKEKAK